MSAAEIIRAFLQGKYPRRIINTKAKQFYFYHVVRAIANLNRGNTNNEMYWSYCTEAYYYLSFGKGSLENAITRSLECGNSSNQTWFEQGGFDRQAERIKTILNSIPANVKEQYAEMLVNNND